MAETNQDTVKEIMKKWASQKRLQEVKILADSLELDGTAISKTTMLQLTEKIQQYSAASIFLRILNPDESLLVYRNACKEHGVSDPVTVLDKNGVVEFFLDTAAPAPPVEAAPQEPLPKKSKRDKSSKRGDKRKHSSSKSPTTSGDVKKVKKLVTNEELFQHLNVVVDKRKQQQETSDIAQKEITEALSATGFEVTPELLEKHKATTAMIVANEIPVGNSASILRVSNPKKNLTRVLELFMETVKTSKSTSSQKPGASTSNRKSYLIGKKPVILVPKGMTSPITMINAHEFLANARYVPRDVILKQKSAAARPTTTFTRHSRQSGTMMEYEILDNPRKLGPNVAEWERIVAVIVLGQSWQFKDWIPGYNTPVELFSRVFGFYVSLEGDKVPAEVTGWAVRQQKLNRDKRGLDSVTFASFWNGLEEWIKIHKPELLPQAVAGS